MPPKNPTNNLSSSIPANLSKDQKFMPVNASERIDLLDILRGFALLGILFMNIEFFSRSLVAVSQFDMDLTGGDWATSWLVKVFIEGKFYKLFSLLFGMGFAVMIMRAEERGQPITAWFMRRMIVLFIFGMAHMIFLWGGDILHDYAFGGLLLLCWILITRSPKFKGLSQPKWFLRIGLTMTLLPVFFALLGGLASGVTNEKADMLQSVAERKAIETHYQALKKNHIQQQPLNASQSALSHGENETKIDIPQITQAYENSALNEFNEEQQQHIIKQAEQRFTRKTKDGQKLDEERHAYAESSYWQTTQYRFWYAIDALKLTPLYSLMVGFPVFMMGYWLVASGIMRRPQEHRQLFQIMAWIGLGFGLILSVSGMLTSLHPFARQAFEIRATGQLLFFFGQSVLAAGYLACIVLLVQHAKAGKILSHLAPLGRMALTNYILQSVILTSLFYGYAGGLYEQVSRSTQMLLVVAILILQFALSHLWLRYFRYGPLEWLWRCLTYLRLQPIKR